MTAICKCPTCDQALDNTLVRGFIMEAVKRTNTYDKSEGAVANHILSQAMSGAATFSKLKPELFFIPNSTIFALSQEEVDATYNDMEQLGIAKLPYPVLDIGIQGNLIMKVENKPEGGIKMTLVKPMSHQNDAAILQDILDKSNYANYEIRFRFENEVAITGVIKNHHGLFFELGRLSPTTTANAAETLRKILIVLLATRNAVKTRTINKALRMGIGAKKPNNQFKPIYTTTITLPEPASLAPNSDSPVGYSGPRRPHLRRGHIRHQRHGPKFAFIREIWISPMFINADEKYISERRQYNVS